MRNWLIPAEYIDLWLSAKCMMTFNDYHVEFFTRGSRTIDIVWIYLGFIWNLFGIYWDLFGIYLGFIRNYLDSLGFIWNLFGIYLGFIWDLFGIYLGFIWDLFGIYLGLFIIYLFVIIF